MGVCSHGYFFNDKKLLKQFIRDTECGKIKDFEKAMGVSHKTYHVFRYNMNRMLRDADYTPTYEIRVTLREKDLDELKPLDIYDEEDLKILRDGFKEFNAKYVFLT